MSRRAATTGDKLGMTSRKFRIVLVVTLVILAVQAWFGDTVAIFFSPSGGVTPPQFSLAGYLQEVESLGFPLIWHTFEGTLLVLLSVAVFALSFRWSKARSVRVASGLGLLMMVSAAIGGLLFVMSGFSYGGGSAQMGGSFMGAFAFYFIALYYAR